jgi:hypothetical protein
MGKVKRRGESYSTFPMPFRVLTRYDGRAMPRACMLSWVCKNNHKKNYMEEHCSNP